MIDDIQNEIKEEKIAAHDETLWGKPANDIITGISNDSNPARAIWEMVQNARDVSQDNGTNISFIKRDGEFIFRHDGLPFDNYSIEALILQTSSKVRNDIVQIGQYGTGFLTTHKFGLKFYLSGSIKLHKEKELYYHFNDFLIDRSTTDKRKMIEVLKEQQAETQRWTEDILSKNRKDFPSAHTDFRYIVENDIEHKNVHEAFCEAPELAPYVIALNDRIKSIEFVDETKTENYRCVRFSMLANYASDFISKCELFDSFLYEVKKEETDNNGYKSERIFSIYLLKSKERDQVTKESKITIILPLSKSSNGIEVFQFSKFIPNLFLYLPLIGTENWGVNFIIHSPGFTCDKDSRDNLRFIGNGQNNDNQAEANQKLIDLANNIIWDFLKCNVPIFLNKKYFAKISFDITNLNPDLAKYYEKMQIKWAEIIERLPIVDLPDRAITPLDIFVLNSELCNALDNKDFNSKKLRHAFYSIMELNDTLPLEEDFVFWSKTIHQWYPQEDHGYFRKIENLVDYVDNIDLTTIKVDNLKVFDEYLVSSGNISYFDKRALLPTEEGKLLKKDSIVKPDIPYNGILWDVMRSLIPDESINKFISKEFSTLLSYNIFDSTTLKEKLSTLFSDLSDRIRKFTLDTKSKFLKNCSQDEQLEPLSIVQIKALFEFVTMLIPINSFSSESKIMKILEEYYKTGINISEKLDNKIYNNRTAFSILINNALLGFTLSKEEKKRSNSIWLKRLITELYGYKETQSILNNFQIYLDQEGNYRYAEELKKESELCDDLKDYYDKIVVGISNEDNDKESIRHSLVDKNFENVFVSQAECSAYDLANPIQNKIKLDADFSNINEYAFHKIVISIIRKFNEPPKCDYWIKLFPMLNENKANIIMSTVMDINKKESIFKILQVEDSKRLQQLANLIDETDFDEILQLGRSALEEAKNRSLDFNYKTMLGIFIEKAIHNKISTILTIHNLSAKILDIQGGQDLIVFFDDNPIYYIEVKSRWSSDSSVKMSKLQFITSIEHSENYSLVYADMTDYDKKDVKEENIQSFFEETINLKRFKVISDIGIRNASLLKDVDENCRNVHLGGDYKLIVPQDLIMETGQPLDILIEKIIKIINDEIK
jgi:hypothetical protein